MDESLQELENELKTLQPRRAPARWLNQINRELAAELPASARPRYATATNLGSWKWLGWRTVSLAAALALVATVGLVNLRRPVPAVAPAVLAADPAPVTPAAVAAYEPVTASNVLYDLKDEGEVKLEGESSARQVRARYVDTYTWKNPRTNASIKWTVPRDEIRVLPASYNPN
jgi:anti-sigma-K factor RskA